MKKSVKIYIVLALMCALLCGCSSAEPEPNPKETETRLESTKTEEKDGVPNLLENEEKTPVVLVDTSGYTKEEEKIVYFTKKAFIEDADFVPVFYIVDVDTKETVFEGKILANKKGDFSSFEMPGTYYIEAPYIGRSMNFSIYESGFEVYEEELKDMLVTNSYGENFQNNLETIAWLCRYEEKAHPVVFSNETPEERKEESAILSQELEKAVVAFDALEDTYKKYQRNSKTYGKEIATYGAVAAQLAECIKIYNSELANAYLNISKNAFLDLNENKDDQEISSYDFYLSASLYKACGDEIYKNAAESYIRKTKDPVLYSKDSSEEKLQEDEAYVYGVLAYMNTAYDVDLTQCNHIMKVLSTNAQRFASDSKKTKSGCVSLDEKSRMLSDRLFVISTMEHVIISQDYYLILNQGIHYLCGCNELGESFITPQGIYHKELDDENYKTSYAGAYLSILYELNHREFRKGNELL